MAEPSNCPKCAGGMTGGMAGGMERGFVVDRGQSGYFVGEWVAGAPVKSLWTGLKLRGKARLEVATWRCRRCGYLESYAAAD